MASRASGNSVPSLMEGYLGKKGKRMGSRVKRYMRLDGAILSNHHAAGAPPSWRVNVKDAVIGHHAKRHKVTIELYNNKLELYAESARESSQWFDALRNAKKKAASRDAAPSNDSMPAASVDLPADIDASRSRSQADPVEDRQDRPANARAHLSNNFKVVKPASRNVSSTDSSGSDEAYEGGPLVVQGQVYEETPASMIFKQFTFPAK
ncbi:unnamed protein product [Chondrus crispus]|uniref:PH domain-containing protein n=1 Tax=Chondrus crispus TaxID=2769 RepID=R7QS02_CHOCR|nr:unnamed protein product [Chondrus crispus]CDF40160.1 unnamed protein product [Chondrus crispus]|eukprot:XP_005710454.1 unnamed protein product [Chondrus crispus]